ncbi:MAG TPA: hypothetical protein VNT51_08715 [Miltoncostaeaceae bacterium]|nr:hypothetical protein [Miltoncostaeaceae bacterium]
MSADVTIRLDHLVDAAVASPAGQLQPGGILLITPEQLHVHSAKVVGIAVRDQGEPGDAAHDLVIALGADALRRTAVTYVGCYAATSDALALTAEIAAVSRVAGHVEVVEGERDLVTPAAARLLRDAGLEVREHRLVPAFTGDPVIRRLSLGHVPDQSGMPPLRVAISDHQGKSLPIQAALEAAGHRVVDDAVLADAVLIDHDVEFHGKRPLVDACVASGGRGLLYPHGADPALMASWDGLYPIYPLLAGALVLSEGHAQIARRYGYPMPTHVIGWPYCPQSPRRPGPVRSVLFAPTHPPYLGNPRYPERNAEMFRRLLACPVELTVRHIGSIETNGLWEVPGVRYVQGELHGAPGMLQQIDAADCVVADRGTFGNLAVARGATTVLWDSVLVYDNAATRHPDNLHLYRDLLHHPFDADDGDMWDLIRAAAADTDRIAAWRERFIGRPLDVDAVTAAIRAL